MTRRTLRVRAISLAALLSCAGADASEVSYENALAQPLCLARDYSREHLIKHSQQVVTSLRIQLANNPSATASKPYQMHFAATVRSRRDRLKTVADCDIKRLTSSPELYLECNVECDGGGMSIKLGEDGRGGLVYLGTPLGRGYISLSNTCGSANSGDYQLEAGLDDHVFRVSVANSIECHIFQDHKVPWRQW